MPTKSEDNDWLSYGESFDHSDKPYSLYGRGETQPNVDDINERLLRSDDSFTYGPADNFWFLPVWCKNLLDVNVENHRENKLLMTSGYVGYFLEAPVSELLMMPFSSRKKMYKIAHVTPHQFKKMKRALQAYQSDPTSEWTGFFTDLLFVAVIVRFAKQFISMMKNHPSNPRIYTQAVLWFAGFYAVWLELTCLESRFCNLPGIVDDAALYLYLGGILVMAIQMQPDVFLFHNRRGFVFGFMLCTIALFIVYRQHSLCNPRARRHCQIRLKTYAISIIATILFLAIDIIIIKEENTEVESIIFFGQSPPNEPLCYLFLIPIFGYHILYQCNSFRVLGEEMLNFESTVVRFGTLIMICSGESVIAIILGFEHAHSLSNQDFMCVAAAFMLLYLLKDVYFNSNCGEEGHALTEDKSPGSVAWVFAHFPLSMFVFFLGCALKYMLHESMEDVTLSFRILIIVSVWGTLLTGIFMRTAHRLFTFTMASLIIRGPYLLILPCGVLITDNFTLLAWCSGAIILSTLADKLLIHNWHAEIASDFLEVGSSDDSNQISIRTIGESSSAAHIKTFKGNQYEMPLIRLLTDFICCRSGAYYVNHAKLLHDSKKRDPADSDAKKAEDAHRAENHDHHGHDHSHGWFGEFCDIVLAAIVIKFAHYVHHGLVEDTEFENFPQLFGESIVGYFGFWILWLELTTTICRVRNIDGNVDDLFYFLILLGNVIMGLTLNGHGFMFDDADGYCFGMLVALSSLFWLHIYVYLMVPPARGYCCMRLCAYLCSITILCLGIWYHGYKVQLCCVCATVFIHGWIGVNSFRVFDQVHLTFEPFVERFGLFVMVVLGESILALVLMPESLDWEVYGAIFLGLMIMFHMKNIYFWSNVDIDNGHALTEMNSPGACFWVVMHAILGYFLMIIGVSFKVFFDDLNSNGFHLKYAELMTWSFFCGLWSMTIIRSSHAAFTFSCKSAMLRIPTTLAFPAGCFFIDKPLIILLWCELWMLVANCLDYILEPSELYINRKPTAESSGGSDLPPSERMPKETWEETMPSISLNTVVSDLDNL